MLYPEAWEVFARGVDADLDRPVVYIGRRLYDPDRTTVYKLVQRPGGIWYNYGQFLSTGRFRITDAPHSDRTRPHKLSDSRLDRVLRSLADVDS